MLTLKELASQTGLSENVTRKFLRLLRSFIGPYIKRGQSNKLLFDPNCLVIFQEIRKLKDQGKSSQEIVLLLKEEYSGAKKITYQHIAPAGQTGQTDTTDYNRCLRDLYQQLLEEKEKRIQEIDARDLRIVRLEIQNVKLTEAMKLLPNGKKPGQIRRAWFSGKKKVQLAAEILSDLKKLSNFQGRKRKILLKELQEHLEGLAERLAVNE